MERKRQSGDIWGLANLEIGVPGEQGTGCPLPRLRAAGEGSVGLREGSQTGARGGHGPRKMHEGGNYAQNMRGDFSAGEGSVSIFGIDRGMEFFTVPKY